MSLRIISRFWTYGRVLFRPIRSYCYPRGKIVSYPLGGPPSRLQRHYENARQILANNILRRVTNPVSSELRKRTTRQLIYGNCTPFFAFVGISLASGSIISKEDELEGLCWEIREAVDRMRVSLSEAESDLFQPGDTVELKSFVIGPLLGIGANAAVYAARRSGNEIDGKSKTDLLVDSKSPISGFPFALKMMFNFDAESNAVSILRSMFCEIIAARAHFIPGDFAPWLRSMYGSMPTLPPHPNIVTMHCAFVDSVAELPESASGYPAALPPRINPDGYGRNKTLFLLMKRYDTTLKEFISSRDINDRGAILISAQLLEAIAHINSNGIAHRDLKSDNILVENDEVGSPRIALTDFGCALADKNSGLVLPFRSYDTNRGGNAALMAPEVSRAEPSLLGGIDYSKSDGWAAGTIIAELLLGWNPFIYSEKNPNPLHSNTYSESDLPRLPGPRILAAVANDLLVSIPSKRPSAAFAANILQLYLWCPSDWLKSRTPPSNTEVIQWLLCLTTKVLTTSSFGERRSVAEYQLISSFLGRLKLSLIKSALAWLRTFNSNLA